MVNLIVDQRKYSDRREYLAKATSIRRLRLKKKLVDSKGGKCQVCGYSRCLIALDFHHIEESKKEFELSQRDLTRSWKKIVDEAKKCVLLCANCHREVHAGLVVLDVNGNLLVK
jgi:hypothetical protein